MCNILLLFVFFDAFAAEFEFERPCFLAVASCRNPTKGDDVDTLVVIDPATGVAIAEGDCRIGNLAAWRIVGFRPMQPSRSQRIVSHEKCSSEDVMTKVMPVVLAAAPLFVMLTAMIAG